MYAYLSLFVCLCSIAAPAWANLRAPVELPRYPSSTLYQPGRAVVALREALTFTCNAEKCDVIADYHVVAQAKAVRHFEFILPTQANVVVQLGNTSVPVQVVASEPFDLREQQAVSRYFNKTAMGTLYRASFTSPLQLGFNTIRISYPQPLSKLERDYGYFKKGRFVNVLQYELWPLKTWVRSVDFEIQLLIKMQQAKPGWWRRHFGTGRSLVCRQVTFEACDFTQDDLQELADCTQTSTFSEKPVQQVDYLVLTTILKDNLPDRLFCEMGDEDLLH